MVVFGSTINAYELFGHEKIPIPAVRNGDDGCVFIKEWRPCWGQMPSGCTDLMARLRRDLLPTRVLLDGKTCVAVER